MTTRKPDAASRIAEKVFTTERNGRTLDQTVHYVGIMDYAMIADWGTGPRGQKPAEEAATKLQRMLAARIRRAIAAERRRIEKIIKAERRIVEASPVAADDVRSYALATIDDILAAIRNK